MWAGWFPLSKLEEKKKFYQDSGTPSKFYQEYMMQVQSEEDSVWTQKHIKYWEGYYEYDKIEIKNTVSSSYNDPTGSFMKTTYISQIGIYDDERNLIAIAKLAKPVKKIEERELTFKLKLDL